MHEVLHCERIPKDGTPLRVAVVTETYPPEVNGVAGTVAKFVEGLRALGHQITVVRPRQAHERDTQDSGLEMLMASLPIPTYPGLRMGLPAGRALKRLWAVERPDIVHVVTEGPLGWSAVHAAGALKIPVTSDFRTNFDSYTKYYGLGWLRRPVSAYLRTLHNRTLVTTAPTTALRKQLLDNGYRSVQTMGRGVDTSRFHPSRRDHTLRSSWNAAPEDPVIGYVGRLAPEKNLPLLLATFQHIRRQHPRARLVLVGEGPYRARIAQSDDIVFAGVRKGVELATYYASFDYFLFPSVTETFGNVTLEAMASGLAIIAYDYGAAGEHIVNGVTGALARFDDGPHFIAQCLHMVGDRSFAATCRAAVRDTAEALDWARVVQRMEAILASAAQSSQPRLSAHAGAFVRQANRPVP